MDEFTLEWEDDGVAMARTVLAFEVVVIGRQQGCDIVLDSNNVSREHAAVYVDGDRVVVRNLSRTSQVVVDGRYRLGTGQTAALRPGESFRLGPICLRVSAPVSIRCVTCANVLSHSPEQFCPHCGTALAEGSTLYGARFAAPAR